MAEESRNMTLVVLGIVAIIAIVGLVLMLSGGKGTKTGKIVNIPEVAGIPGCDSPCNPVLVSSGVIDEGAQIADFEAAYNSKCWETGVEDPRYPGTGPIFCCCPNVAGVPFQDFGDVPNERGPGIPVEGGYVIER
jgi:hypothetical protein